MARATQGDPDAAQLERLGYAQQLARRMGVFSNFALSFSVISILTGAVTLYGFGLQMGGPRALTVGWPLVSLLTLAVAASMAELASAFPTAGALYHWAALLGGPAWGYATAALNTVGQFAITASIDYGLAVFVHGLLGWSTRAPAPLALCAAVLVSQAVLNHAGVRAVAVLNWISAWYHLVGVVAVVGVLAVAAPHAPTAFAFAAFSTRPPPYAYGFLIGLLPAAWTFTGYDASAHISEETLDPARAAPRGMMAAVAVSAVAGFALLCAVTLAISDLPAAAAADNPYTFILEHAMGPSLGRALVWLAVGAMWFCGLASVTSNSRMLFAFARDGGLPGSKALASVSERFRTPHVAVWCSAAGAFAVAAWSEALSAMTALSTIALYASYGVPILLGAWARRRGVWVTRGPWHLGRWSTAVNAVALAWIAAALLLFVLPPNQLAGYTFSGAVFVFALYWFAYLRRRFKGPPVAWAAATATSSAPTATPS